jgi:hypothetical protein
MVLIPTRNSRIRKFGENRGDSFDGIDFRQSFADNDCSDCAGGGSNPWQAVLLKRLCSVTVRDSARGVCYPHFYEQQSRTLILPVAVRQVAEVRLLVFSNGIRDHTLQHVSKYQRDDALIVAKGRHSGLLRMGLVVENA